MRTRFDKSRHKKADAERPLFYACSFIDLYHVGLNELRRIRRVAADADDQFDIGAIRKLFQLGEKPFERFEGVVHNLQEAVDKKIFKIKILCRNAGKEPIEHLGAVDVELGCIHKADAVLELKHVLVVVIDKHNTALCGLDRLVRHVDDSLRLARTLFAENHTYQGKSPPSAPKRFT